MASPFAFSLKKASGESEVGGEKDGVLPHSTNTTTKSWQTAPFSDATFDGGGTSDLPTSSVECGSAFDGGGSERKPTFTAPSFRGAVPTAGSSTFSFGERFLGRVEVPNSGAAPVFSDADIANMIRRPFSASGPFGSIDWAASPLSNNSDGEDRKQPGTGKTTFAGDGYSGGGYGGGRYSGGGRRICGCVVGAYHTCGYSDGGYGGGGYGATNTALEMQQRMNSVEKGRRFIATILKEKAFIRCLSDFTSVSQTVRLLNTCRSLHEVEAEVFCKYRLPRILVDKEASALCRAMVGTPVYVKPQPIPPEPKNYLSTEYDQWKQERENERLNKLFGILPANTVYDSSRWFAWFDTSEVQDLKIPNWMTDEQMLSMLGDGRFPKLKSLEKSCQNGKNISDSTIAEVARRFPDLQSLAIKYSGITDIGVIAVANRCPNLKSINLWSCEKITDASIVQVVKKCRHLQSLLLGVCGRITDTSVIEIARGCPHLQKLSLASCGTITDDVMVEIARGCPHLKSLDVRNSYDITDISVLAIAHNCPSLQKLNLGKIYGENITDESVMEIARCCPHLQSLKLGECKYIDDASIMEVGRRCPHLRELDVGCCKNIGDASIIEIARGCPHLERLELYQCHRITNASIFAVAKGCPELQLLQLFACDKITDQSLASVVKGCPNIKNIRRPGLFG